MVGIIGGIGNGAGNAWGQIKKVVEPIVDPIVAPIVTAITPTPPPPTASEPAPVTPVEPTPPIDSPAQPLTYSAPTYVPGPRQAAVASNEPRSTLSERLTQAGYYGAAASAVADPTTQTVADKTAPSQSQVMAQAAYAMVARADESNRQALIEQS
jgi:hypothetical protein